MNYKPEFFHQAINLLSYALNLVATQNSSLEDEKKKNTHGILYKRSGYLVKWSTSFHSYGSPADLL